MDSSALAPESRVSLVVGDRTVRLIGAGVDVTAELAGPGPELTEASTGLRRLRSSLVMSSELPPSVSSTPVQVGRLMMPVFLPGPVGAGFAEVLAAAEAGTRRARIGFEIAPRWRELPWEALPMPDDERPIAVHPRVAVYRRYPAVRPAPPPGPLRILVAISSPGSDDGDIGRLNYERELRNVLAATGAAHERRAEVTILRFATPRAIRRALGEVEPHILHLSAHGRPGVVELENDDGTARWTEAKEFAAKAVPGRGMPSMIVLSTCYSDVAPEPGALTFATELIERGASVVVGTEAAVTDRYATMICSRLYAELAGEDPDVITALAQARRSVADELAGSPDPRDRDIARLEEWAAVTVLATSDTAPVVADQARVSREPRRPRHAAQADLPALPSGEFVGRRDLIRRCLADLRGDDHTGLVLHGIAGIGKTALAAEVLTEFAQRWPKHPVVVVDGANADAATLQRQITTEPGGRRPLSHDLPTLVVLNDFDGHLERGPQVPPGWRSPREPATAQLLADLLADPGRWRLLITCRHPLVLPGGAERALAMRSIGPLSAAETARLSWALPCVGRLGDDGLDRIAEAVGGHPGALRSVEELLAEGLSLSTALDRAVTTTARSAQVDSLYRELREDTEAADLLMRSSVYRAPVEWQGLEYLYAELEPGISYNEKLAERNMRRILAEEGYADFDGFLLELPSEVRARIAPHELAYHRPHDPRGENRDMRVPIRTCTATGLMSTGELREVDGYQVHRWVAVYLDRRWSADPPTGYLVMAHRCAAEFWQWRALVILTQADIDDHRDNLRWDEQRDLDRLREARHHLLAAGERIETETLDDELLERLHRLGLWTDEQALILNALDRSVLEPARRADYLGRLGEIARGQGHLKQARHYFEHSVDLARDLVEYDDRHDHRLGLMIALDRFGEFLFDDVSAVSATMPYQEAYGMAFREYEAFPKAAPVILRLVVALRHMGDLLVDDGDTEDAEEFYRGALREAVGLTTRDPEDPRYIRECARLLAGLGGIAHDAGRLSEAEEMLGTALRFSAELRSADRTHTDRLELARAYLRRGDISRVGGDASAARRYYRSSRQVFEALLLDERSTLEIRQGLGETLTRLGDLALDQGQREQAELHYRHGRAILLRMADDDRGTRGIHRALAILSTRLAEFDYAAGRFDAAATLLEAAVNSYAAVLRAYPTDRVTATLEHCAARERLGAALLGLDRRADGLLLLDQALADRDMLRAMHDRDDLIYGHGHVPDRIALVEGVATAHLARMRASETTEPNRSTAIRLLEDLDRRGRLTDSGRETLDLLHEWS
ncbi:CHAT domain-containing protein [Nocardia xishanensis]